MKLSLVSFIVILSFFTNNGFSQTNFKSINNSWKTLKYQLGQFSQYVYEFADEIKAYNIPDSNFLIEAKNKSIDLYMLSDSLKTFSSSNILELNSIIKISIKNGESILKIMKDSSLIIVDSFDLKYNALETLIKDILSAVKKYNNACISKGREHLCLLISQAK